MRHHTMQCVLLFSHAECDYNGQTYNPGDTFNSTDGCNTWLVHSNTFAAAAMIMFRIRRYIMNNVCMYMIHAVIIW